MPVVFQPPSFGTNYTDLSKGYGSKDPLKIYGN